MAKLQIQILAHETFKSSECIHAEEAKLNYLLDIGHPNLRPEVGLLRS